MEDHLTFEIFKKEVENFKFSSDNSYVKTYIGFLKYFENLKIIDEHN
jgi:hypothetical protein